MDRSRAKKTKIKELNNKMNKIIVIRSFIAMKIIFILEFCILEYFKDQSMK